MISFPNCVNTGYGYYQLLSYFYKNIFKIRYKDKVIIVDLKIINLSSKWPYLRIYFVCIKIFLHGRKFEFWPEQRTWNENSENGPFGVCWSLLIRKYTCFSFIKVQLKFFKCHYRKLDLLTQKPIPIYVQIAVTFYLIKIYIQWFIINNCPWPSVFMFNWNFS